MERPSSVNHGALRLPPGFRFHPTDEELVVQYLRRKALAYPLPVAIIPDVDVGRFNPWDLPGGSIGERYFFNLRERRHRSRGGETGYWKASGKERAVVARSGVVVGVKKTMVFYQGRPRKCSRTDWVMHEYRLAGAETEATEWVVCRVFMRKRVVKIESLAEEEASCVTEDVDGPVGGEEEASSGSSNS